MKRWLSRMFLSAARSLRPAPLPPSPREIVLSNALAEQYARQDAKREEYMEHVSELAEAVQMCGSGPWKIGPQALEESNRIIAAATSEPGTKLREANVIGAFGDLELALQNVEWRREVQFSWLQFTRWGIQQIILISRLYYIKNPLIRRLINISSFYVFGRGVEVSSPDEAANEVLKEFFERNKKQFGVTGLIEAEKRNFYDGNLFWCFFPDKNTGRTTARTIDATEIQDIVCDPEDADTPQYYQRVWSQRSFDTVKGASAVDTKTAWYPALNYDPPNPPQTIGGAQVMWDSPVLHRKSGYVAKWNFGCPQIYPALEWAKSATKYLNNCATKAAALSQFAFNLTTKGGQQALEAQKQQLQTQAGPQSQIWDTNPPAVAGSIFGSGPGTTLSPMVTRGAGDDPEEVRQYKLMCCIVVGVPETFLADVSTGNLATATTLDRPTELCFLEKQESWREDLQTIAQYVLKVSGSAPSGRLKEAHKGAVVIREARGKLKKLDGKWLEAGAAVADDTVIVSVNFPAIREGDIPQLVDATVRSMTLGNAQGQVVGIDEKAGVRRLYDLQGIENGDELTEEQYPEATYEPEREVALPPAPAPAPGRGGLPPNGSPPVAPPNPPKPTEAKRGFTRNSPRG